MSANDNKRPYKTIFIASDHAGLDLKRHLLNRYPHLPFKDLGTMNGDSVDYPDYADRVCRELEGRVADACGILICGSGQGMAIRANRFKWIRAALCWSEEVAALAREHNDANVLCLGGRLLTFPMAEKIFDTFLSTPFAGGRHQGRVDKLNC